jgi:hypothetical protein
VEQVPQSAEEIAMNPRLLSLFVPTLAIACSAGPASKPQSASAAISFEAGPTLSAPRATHALIRVAGGRLLAIGGCVRNGCEPGPASATIDIIAADASRIEASGRLLARRIQPSAVALADGRALILGGWVDGRVTATTELFDPVTRQSSAGPTMLGPRSAASVVRLNDGRILIAGGYDGERVRGDAEIFDPATLQLTPTGDLAIARSGASATPLGDGTVLIAGGGDGESQGRRALSSAEIFDPATGTFVATGALGQRRYKHGAVALPSGDVLIIGGSDERDYAGKLRSVERYDAASGRFVTDGALASARFKLADAVMLISPDTVLVAAGDEHPEIYDIARHRGRMLADSLDGQWNYMTIARAGAGRALLAGGYREGRIEPTNRSWIVRFAPPG